MICHYSSYWLDPSGSSENKVTQSRIQFNNISEVLMKYTRLYVKNKKCTESLHHKEEVLRQHMETKTYHEVTHKTDEMNGGVHRVR